MRLFTQKVFSGSIAGGATVYTLPEFDQLLGRAEKLAIEIVLSDVSGSPTNLTVNSQWSNTGSIWSTRSSGLVNQANPTATTYQAVDTATTGLFSRLQLVLTGGTSINAAIYVCGRGEQNWM
jgi:hypothetical protein